MKKIYYKQGAEVGKGTYWGIVTGSKVEVAETFTLLENSIKAHTAVMLACAPMIGLVFAVFLPLIGILMTMKFVYDWASDRVLGISYFSWNPVRAYLVGRENKKKALTKESSSGINTDNTEKK